MSHNSGGYFYYRYTYDCPYTDANGNHHTDDTYDTALYSPAARQDHKEQTKWYKEKFLPAAQADIEKNFYGDADRNTKGRKYDRYQSNFIRQIDFMWTKTLPTHDTGPLRGYAYGKEI
ncbi:uncharacterized protein F4822DRAFT_426636 [Hypoxylon trugodes]|uniref:uncharacterized protein n=1 Tax=Hypoxylon trugodes TaxID=326681 RepID=UPI0021A014AD|nr:uncharacterized protein F4822DRAFT_426636 [Hypoxylon trugodes]KAI1390791.1 hypothetical protein F4822DRAFT_426636 [Hypoxylon trugodes]